MTLMLPLVDLPDDLVCTIWCAGVGRMADSFPLHMLQAAGWSLQSAAHSALSASTGLSTALCISLANIAAWAGSLLQMAPGFDPGGSC